MRSTEMKNLQKQSSTQASHESQSEQHHTNAPVTDSGSGFASSNDSKEVSWHDVERVKIWIERCLQLHMDKDETVNALLTLLTHAKIEPKFTTLVWQMLEKDNIDFFRAYYICLKLEKQIHMFNHLIEKQYRLMMRMCAPIHSEIHPMPVNNLPMRYPLLQQPSIAEASQPHLDSSGGGISRSHVVIGVPVPSSFHTIQTNSADDMLMDYNALDVAPVIPPYGTMPTSVASNGYCPFPASEISGMDTNASALDMSFTSNAESSIGLQFASDNGAGISRPLDQNQRNFSLSDLTDISILGDLGELWNHPGSPFMQSDSGIMFESSNKKDVNNVDDFFGNSEPTSDKLRRGFK